MMMVSPQKYYVQEISKKTNYRANWLPDKPMNVGDVGKMEDGIFTLYTTLEQQGIGLKVAELSSSLNSDYTSNESVKVTMNGHDLATGVPGIPITEGRILCKIDFQKSDGVFFQICEPSRQVLENLSEIETEILDRYKKGVWNLGWVVVSEVVRPQSSTIMINSFGTNVLEFELNSGRDQSPVNLADTSLGLHLLRETGTCIKYLAKNNLTPLFAIKGISDPLFGKTKFRGANAYRAIQFNALRDLPFDPSEIE
jgi:hypothetical protein